MNTPVLFLIFNRPDVTQKVFDEIKKQKPKYLYVAADGPRLDKPDESEKCKQTREILNQINWDCEVKTLFREENLGCKKAVSSAISWFFENVEEGIILEDDCLPNQSFFRFCEQLLERYRYDNRIMHIGGCNFLDESNINTSYYFSKMSYVWGWATWKRAWKCYDVEMKNYPEFVKTNQIENIFTNKYHQKDWLKILYDMYDNKIDTWDFIWCYTVFSQNGLSIVPAKNLITNIGFGDNSTHTTDINNQKANRLPHEIEINLIHPEFIMPNEKAINQELLISLEMSGKFNLNRIESYNKIIRELNRIKKQFKNRNSN